MISIAGQKPRDIVDAYAILLKQKTDQPFQVVLENAPPMEIHPRAVPVPDAIVQAKSKLGVTIEAVTPMLAEKLGLATEEGMFISEVSRGSVAAKAGLKPGDVILQLGRYRIATLTDFSVLLQHLPSSGKVRIGVMRGQAVGFGTLDL